MKQIIAAFLFSVLACAAQERQITEVRATPAEEGSPAQTAGFLQSQKGPPPDFIPVDKQPVPILNPAPHYPDSARRSGMEGTVWVKIWVDEQGKAHQAEVLKSDNDIFNTPTIEAALQWTFQPARLHDKPVAVWVSIPFKYKLSKDGAGKHDGSTHPPKPVKKPARK